MNGKGTKDLRCPYCKYLCCTINYEILPQCNSKANNCKDHLLRELVQQRIKVDKKAS